MGNCKSASSVLDPGSAPGGHKLTIAILGLDNAGKTVTAQGLLGASVHDVTPTIGFSSVSFTFERNNITLYDLGGGAKIRDIWSKYYAEVYGFVFVVDSSSESRMSECQHVLKLLVEHELVRGKPLLLLANKQDVSGALDEEDIVDVLQLEGLANQFKTPCHVVTCAALIDLAKKDKSSIHDGFRWLMRIIDADWMQLHERVSRDVAAKAEKDKQEKIERAKRVQRSRELREQEERSQGRSTEDVIGDGYEPENGENPFQPISRQVAAAEKRLVLSRGTSHQKPTEEDDNENARKMKNKKNKQSTKYDHKQTEDDYDRRPQSRAVRDASVGNLLDDNGNHSHRERKASPSRSRSADRHRQADSDDIYDNNDRSVGRYQRLDRDENASPDAMLRPSRVPNSQLEPLENATDSKKKKKKFRLLRNKTGPSPGDDGSGRLASGDETPSSSPPLRSNEDTRHKKLQPLKPLRSPHTERMRRDENSDPEEQRSFKQKWNLVDDLAYDGESSSKHLPSRGSRPNFDYDSDLVT